MRTCDSRQKASGISIALRALAAFYAAKNEKRYL
jgi:hypothetical protein